jgi:cellobiose phosphorylase
MDKVGEHGKGESVWLAFFLFEVLTHFAEVAKIHGDQAFAGRCLNEVGRLQKNIEANAWDGKWYRRAYFDDGTPLGSSANAECQIDSISQSWSILSGAGEPGRAWSAMDEVDRRLVRRESSLIQLLTPPFDSSALNPGYIKGYVPGVRENGGQYTHAAVWTAMAFAKMGDSARAWELADMINPINHSNSVAHTAIYKAEPYVIAADVYAVAPHIGRGGWTWYTGSAGWMYRLLVESLLGLHLESNTLTVKPCIPAAWRACKLEYRYGRTMYRIAISQGAPGDGAQNMRIDGVLQDNCVIRLIDDGVDRHVDIRCGS